MWLCIALIFVLTVILIDKVELDLAGDRPQFRGEGEPCGGFCLITKDPKSCFPCKEGLQCVGLVTPGKWPNGFGTCKRIGIDKEIKLST